MNILNKTVAFGLFLIAIILKAQSSADLPKRFANTVYDVQFLKMSTNNKWLCFQKSYDNNSDTLVVVDRQKPNTVYFQKSGVIPLYTKFTSRGYLFTRTINSVELLKLPSSEPVVWKNIKEAVYDSRYNVILMIKDNQLLILDEEGNMVNKISEVKRLLSYGDEKFAVFSEKAKESLYKLIGKNSNKLYTSLGKIKFILESNDLQTIVLEENEIDKNRRVLCINHVNKKETKILSLGSGFDEKLAVAEVHLMSDQKYFLRITVNKKKRNSEVADVWYSNDNALEKKFYNDTEEYNFIWNTKTNTVETLTRANDEKAFYFGNPSYFFKFDPFKDQDYTNNNLNYSLQLIESDKKTSNLTIKSPVLIVDQKGNFLLTLDNNYWQLYNLKDHSHRQIHVEYKKYHKYGFPKAYFSDNGNRIIFEMKDFLYEYQTETNQLKKIPAISGYETEILNAQRSTFLNGFNFSNNTYDSTKPILIRLYNREENTTSLATYDGNRMKILLKPTTDNISAMSFTDNAKSVFYVKNTMSQVPKIIYNYGKEREVFETNSHDINSLKGLKSVIVKYKGPNDDELSGVLVFPLGYKEEQKYPMVVSIYEKQRHLSNKYLKDGFKGPSGGFNIRNFIQKGYFVFLPDITLGSIGTGESALYCVHKSLDALKDVDGINFQKVGLIGFSHGGYETNFIATRSDRFAAYIAGAGNSDLMGAYFSYNYHFNSLYYWQFENGQFEMPQPFFSDKKLYIENSPVYRADQVKAPILLWTGSIDKNVDWKQTMEYFLSLKRSGKTAMAVFYPNEGHGLTKLPNLLDVSIKVEDWFDFFLKGKNAVWIEKGIIKKDAN